MTATSADSYLMLGSGFLMLGTVWQAGLATREARTRSAAADRSSAVYGAMAWFTLSAGAWFAWLGSSIPVLGETRAAATAGASFVGAVFIAYVIALTGPRTQRRRLHMSSELTKGEQLRDRHSGQGKQSQADAGDNE